VTARSAVMDIQAKLRARLVGQKKEAKDVNAAPVDERDSASIYADLRAKQAASASKEQVASTPRSGGKRTKDTGTGKGTTNEGGAASAGAGGGAGAGSSGGKKRPRPTRDDSSTTGTDAGRSKKPRALDIEAALAKLVKHLVRLVFCKPRFVCYLLTWSTRASWWQPSDKKLPKIGGLLCQLLEAHINESNASMFYKALDAMMTPVDRVTKPEVRFAMGQ